MVFNHELVNKFLEAIFPLPERFGLLCYNEQESEPIYFQSFQNAIWEVDKDASVDFGISKIVIMSPNLGDVVIKIPFNGYFEETISTKSMNWYPFKWAPGSDSCDYCLAEFQKYNRLKTYGLGCFVAKTFFYKKVCGVRVFLQEKIIPYCDLYDDKKPSQKSLDLADKWYNEGKICIDPEWIANCLDKYGKSKVERFLNYCVNIDPDILEDIHYGNFGYRENNTPCILDYSNFVD